MVDRAALTQARNGAIGLRFASSHDPDIFCKIDRLELRRTLPSMMCAHRGYAAGHPGIANMIAEQQGPCDDHPVSVASTLTGFANISALDVSASQFSCSKDTLPGFDAITNPFLWWLQHAFQLDFRKMVADPLINDHLDCHVGKVVLVQKASKPQYDVVKSWRMIALLPTFSKLLERIVLVRLAGYLELGDTQFGSRKKRGVPDALATVLEFLEDHHGMSRLLVSMDVEGGFDKLDRGLFQDSLAARGCPADVNDWIGRWCQEGIVRFRFTGRISGDYNVQQGVPQGCPLSPFLFRRYVADVLCPRV